MGTNPKVAFHTLGCKLNQAETELMARRFAAAGYQVVDRAADVYILNTCTVTHIADRKSRHLLRLWRKQNPEAFIVATGCYAQRAPNELSQVGADLVVSNEKKTCLPELIKRKLDLVAYGSFQSSAPSDFSRVRSFVKIQDGCNDFCAYCIVPAVRGPEYCLPVTEIIEEIKARVSHGYKEIVLTGTKIGAYRHNGDNLIRLVERILADTDVVRLHLSSLQPHEVSPELLSLWQDDRLCRHFHLALQSGSDSVLRRMRRRYTAADYRHAVSLIRQMVPDVAITTDIMVGFPGETDAEFEESYRVCQEIGFANIHVFNYSPRPRTLASQMPDQISDRVKKERSLRMLELARESARRFWQRFVGHTALVLWEREVTSGSGIYSGLSHNYIRVFGISRWKLTNRLLPVRLVQLHEQGLWGELIE